MGDFLTIYSLGLMVRDTPAEFTYLFHRTRLAVADVRFFISQLQVYCHSEVIDCSWRVLEEFAMKKEGDLDSLIEAHKVYLDRLVTKALLIVKKGDRKVSPLRCSSGG